MWPRVANRFATSRANGWSLTLSGSPGVVASLRLCRCDCGLVLGGLASAVARVTRVGWVAGVDVAEVDVARVDVVASGVCVVLASRRAWSLVIGGSWCSLVGLRARICIAIVSVLCSCLFLFCRF